MAVWQKVTTSGAKVISSASPTMIRKNGRRRACDPSYPLPGHPLDNEQVETHRRRDLRHLHHDHQEHAEPDLVEPRRLHQRSVMGRVMTMLDMPSNTQPRIA